MSEVLVDTLNKRWKDDKTAFGYKMLMKMGWKEEKGLGKNDTGTVSHIKISKREEGLGLGMERSTDGAGSLGWNATATSFNQVLNSLKEVYGNDKDKKKSKKDKKNKKSKSEKKSSTTIISVGIKYKKLSAAKDMSSKSAEDMKAVLGAAVGDAAKKRERESSEEISEPELKKKKKKKDKKKKSSDDEEEDI